MEIKTILGNLKKLPPTKKTISNAWLTVNRICNMNCPWCYAGNIVEKKDSDMDYEKAKCVVDMLEKNGITHITILGGEPTLYYKLPELINYIHRKHISTTLVTNGIKLSDKEYCKTLKAAGVETISISVKACNNQEYEEYTNIKNAYSQVIEGINNVSSLQMKMSISFVLTKNIFNGFLKTVEECCENGASHFSLSFCYDFSNMESMTKDYDIRDSVLVPLKWFESHYEEINKVTKGDFRIKQSLPLCAWSDDIIKKLEENGQISYTCQVLKQSGIVFDNKLRLIPCNAMHKLVLGEYDKDFSDEAELNAYLKTEKVDEVYQCFKTLPSKECYQCEKKIKCRGGCISNWFNFTLEEFLSVKKAYEKI